MQRRLTHTWRFWALTPALLLLGAPAQGEQQEEAPLAPPPADEMVGASQARRIMYEGMVAVQDEMYEEAIPKLEWVIENEPALLGAWESLGWAYWLTGRHAETESLWQRLVTIAPNEPMGYNLLAQIATRDGQYERATELYETSLRLDPDQYETELNLARVLLWSGEQQRAATLLRRLFRRDTDRIDVQIDLAWAMYINEEYEQVIEHWDHINEMIPDNPTYLLARANVLILMGDLTGAETDALHVLEVDPGNVDALNMLASLAVRWQRPEEAVAALRRVMNHTDDREARARIAMRIAVYMKSVLDQGSDLYRPEDVLRVIRESLDYEDGAVGTHLYYGELLSLDRQYAEAEKVFKHVLERFNPYSQRALFGLVESYFGRAMYDDAERQLRENYGQFNAHNPFRHVLWARLHFARGQFVEAIHALDRLEHEGSQGSVFSLLYHGISPSEFSQMPSVRQLQEQLMALRRDGFRFITPSELSLYFEQKKPAGITDERPWLNRSVQSLRHAWTGQKPDHAPSLRDYSPDKVVMVTFDDALRTSFRYGSQVAEDLGVRMTMFVGVGDVLSPARRFIASFPEIRAHHDSGMWEIHSHLWDAGILAPGEEEGRPVAQIANRLWLPDRNRQETLRQYQTRLRREFRDSQRVLARELSLEKEDVFAVAYPYGDVGQESETNIELFRVSDVVLNEAEITYKMGFIQFRHGYTMKTDDPMLYKRFEPDRNSTGRQVLREAYRQHPVYTARRMRAEMAALSGRLQMARENIELLRRDGYPEEDLAEVQEYVRRHLARLSPLLEPVSDSRGRETDAEPLIAFQQPYLGVEGKITRANVMIDDREAAVFAGLKVNRRLGVQVRGGVGRIRQTVITNVFVEVERTSVTSSLVTERRVENGETTTAVIDRTTISVDTVLSNEIQRTAYEADKQFVGAVLHYTHPEGSVTMAEVHYHLLDGAELDNEDATTFGVEHQWRPVPAMDLAARFHRGLVPSARAMLRYDSVALRPYWRILDGWHANALGFFAYYQDRNSLVKTEVENYWRLSEPYDIWLGMRNWIDTVDQDSDLYWTPFWEQRHAILLRVRRSYPQYYGVVRAHIGIQKSRARREEMDRYLTARAQGEAQGWSPGRGPEQGWQRMLGFAGTVARTFPNGLEIGADFSVNSSDEYTEHNASLRLMYAF